MVEQKAEKITVEIELKGTAPLMMHNPANMQSKTSSRGTTIIPEPEDEAKAGLYQNKDGVIYIPSRAILGCMREAGKDMKAGKGRKTFKQFVLGCLSVEPEEIPLIYTGNYRVDTRRVVLQRTNGIPRSRPVFDNWSCKFNVVSLDTNVISEPIIKKMLQISGKYIGLLDFRPQFGRFEVVSCKVIKREKVDDDGDF
jgi:hypothetical protein